MTASFPTPTPADWRAEAEKALKGRPLESLLHLDADGLLIRPLYAEATGVAPLFAPRGSDADGRAWDLRAVVEGDDPVAVNDAVLAELQGGAASILLSGAVLSESDALRRALSGVALELAPVALDAGPDGPGAANALAVAAKGSPRARLMFHLDPITDWAARGAAPRSIEECLSLAAATAERHAGAYPEARLFLASGRAAHEAGGSAAQELGLTCASAVALIRAALEAGLPVERAVSGVVLGVSVDAVCFDSLAKVRALRLMWATLAGAFGQASPAVIEARSSRRMLAARDPWPNLLRLTAAAFAGAVGGADAVALDGFTRASGRPDAFARRQARNTQLVLMEEAGLGRVDDPGAGSWYLDSRAHDLAQAGWDEFQRIEREGGVVASLRGGALQSRVAAARKQAQAAFGPEAARLIGVTAFIDPDVRPAPVEVSGAPTPAPTEDRITPLVPVRWAQAFEEASA